VLLQKSRLKIQHRVITEQMREVRLKKDQLPMKMKKRAGCSSGACQHSVELAQIKQELADLKATINRQPPVQRVRPANFVVLSDEDDTDVTDVEPNSP
jgi:hypothetical protein